MTTDVATTDPTQHSTVTLPSDRAASEATRIEQQRAIAEVQAMVVVAQQCPRDVQRAIAAMRETCAIPAVANNAGFRYNRGGSQVTGPSITLATELARIWGNIDYGIKELGRDDSKAVSEMLAVAWDLQTNTRAYSTFLVPHRRDTTEGTKPLASMRDIYENNANMGARRVREMIFRVLPRWFRDEAVDLCARTVRDGGGVPLSSRIASAIEQFGVNAGVTQAQLEAKIGRKSGDWTAYDVAELVVIAQSLARGEINVEDEFPRDAAPLTAETVKAAGGKPAKVTKATIGRIKGMMTKLGLSDTGEGRAEYLQMLAAAAGRTDGDPALTSATELTRTEGEAVLATWQRTIDQMPEPPEPQPGNEPVTGAEAVDLDAVETAKAERAEAFSNLINQAARRRFTQTQVEETLRRHFGQPVEDLTAAQIQEFLAAVAYGSIKIVTEVE